MLWVLNNHENSSFFYELHYFMKEYQWYNANFLLQFLPIYLVKGYEIFLACDRHSVETVTTIKYVAEYEQARKWMAEFLSTFQGRDIEIVRVNSIRDGSH